MEGDTATPSPDCTAARVFELLWETIADVLGSAATATLMRRSARRAAGRRRDLDGLLVTRSGFNYSYTIPEHWRGCDPESLVSVRELARELSPLLIQLTGPVVIRRLRAVPDLQRCEVLFEERL